LCENHLHFHFLQDFVFILVYFVLQKKVG